MSEEELSGVEISRALIPAIEEQMESAETPFVKGEYIRLTEEEGEEPEEAKMMMALCLADEIEALQLEGREFSLERYEKMLKFLPNLPEE